MRELEVRLALVCFGGASLAVYMNGISHEILKLVRASKVYHGLTAQQKADPNLRYQDAAPDRPYSTDTEEHYFELLRMAGKHIDLRVVVDVISGASAGGINGIFLARALAYDLDFEPLRQMWLEHGDIEELMETETLAERGSKLFLYPFIWLFGNRIWQGEKPSAEARRKLSRFLRSRWFKPPFSGRKMLKWMLEANINMGQAKPQNSLLPVGHQLDLFVSVTNFFGYRRTVHLHDPETISEQQHQLSLNFRYRQSASGQVQSDFDDSNVPGLGFAARATSSFPGAFPPVTIKDLKAYLDHKKMGWPHEAAFHRRNFQHLEEDKETIERMHFIDGGVTNNKPFADAIKAVHLRPAHREVNRRIIFVDPRPDAEPDEHYTAKSATKSGQEPSAKTEHSADKDPGFFQTILSSLAEIPRTEPILGNLQAIEEQNRQTRRLESVLEKVEKDVAQLVSRIIALEAGQHVSTTMLATWREKAHEEAHARAGFSYGAYVEGKRAHLLDHLASTLAAFRNRNRIQSADQKTDEQEVLQNLSHWADENGYRSDQDAGGRSMLPLFRRYDVDFRVRRLRFLVKRTNLHLQRSGSDQDIQQFRSIKRALYELIELYELRWRPTFYGEIDAGCSDADWINAAGDRMALEDLDLETDRRVADVLTDVEDETVRAALFRSYVGFAFYDIVSLPMTAQHDLKEIDEILVDRISPLDCTHLHENGKSPLMGSRLFNFGAFFSRTARENDYIWGRIHAANRLLDFVIDAAGKDALISANDVETLRSKLALTITETESKHVRSSHDLIRQIRSRYGQGDT